ncbi:response regulator [Nakamurella sp. YIM 132087]|uniref:Response regulator n=1 Tax=Nakamurella alba TaxID=2665158 RepID=A0A7K1FPL3_9ACTN|nr:response regulator transcription factor [Nakamurella alba]MTD16082.1 response regulator [Nakamurella alba]
MSEDAGMDAPPIRLLIADDQAAIREALATMLDLTPGLEVVGTAADGAAAVAETLRLRPDVVLMDLRMPVLDGAGATARILAAAPEVAVLVLTTHADEPSILAALSAGARGYLTKQAGRADIARAVRAAAAGQSVLDPEVQAQLVRLASHPPTPVAAVPDLPVELSERETEVLRQIAGGLSNQEIAAALFVSEATVKTHINNLFAKTGVRDRAQAVRYAFLHGLGGDR